MSRTDRAPALPSRRQLLRLGAAGAAVTDEQASRRVAKAYPKVAFVMGSGEGPAEPNFGVFDDWIHEPGYLSGMIAGKLTKSNVIGVVAAMSIPEVNREINAFCAGAKE